MNGAPDNTSPLSEWRRKRQAVFEWMLRNARHSRRQGREERAAEWLTIAGRVAHRYGCGVLVSVEMERELFELAHTLGSSGLQVRNRAGDGNKWVHVMTEAMTVGGHTALVRRWIANDTGKRRHSLVLTQQDDCSVNELVDAVQCSGGEVVCLGSGESYGERARRLREYVRREADVVVLHIHPWDVIPSMALGLPGGPPVLLLNHADHTFWIGAGIADAVLSIRHSGADVARHYRGVERNLLLPIPLPPPGSDDASGQTPGVLDIRTRLGIPPEAIVILTVGSAYKYTPFDAIDFPAAIRQVLERSHEAHIVAVGPDPDADEWRTLREFYGERVHVVGPQDDPFPYYRAADVYVEGFPFGSLTALLEAGAEGLPCIRAPKVCPLPFVSDDPALDEGRPENVAAYVESIRALVASPERRMREGRKMAASVSTVHMPVGWKKSLDRMISRLDQIAHAPRLLPEQPRMPKLLDDYWTRFLRGRHTDDPLAYALQQAARKGLRTRPDWRLWREGRPMDVKPMDSALMLAVSTLPPRVLHRARHDKRFRTIVPWPVQRAVHAVLGGS